MITIYTIEPMECPILFCCEKSFETVQEYAKTTRIDKQYLKEILECDNNQDGMVMSDDNTDKPFLFYIKDRKHDWYFWEVLNHEISHLVFYLARHYGFTDETEYQATLHESLFRNFRRLIQNK